MDHLKPTPHANSLAERYHKVFPSYLTPFYDRPLAIDRGEGSWVFDYDGNKYLDFFGGILTTMIGHSHPKVTEAVQSQAAKVMHTSTLYLSEPMIRFAEELAEVSGISDARVFLTTSGTEANDTALLLATNYRKSNEVLAMRNSYHGRSMSCQAITSHRSWSTSALSGLSVNFVQGPYRLRSPFADLDDASFTQACVQDLTQVLDMMTAGDVACLIAEPIQGVGGFATPPDGFFKEFKKVLDDHGILFVSDEVQTGWGRTGEHFWGYQAHDITPDILTFAKGVGNGITLAGVVARGDVMNCLDGISFSTFGGNPLSAAAGSATLSVVREENLQQNAAIRGAELHTALAPICESTDWIAELRGKGLMQAIEICEPNSTVPDAQKTAALIEVCKDRGLLVGKGGLYGNVIRLTPMLNVSEQDLATGAQILVEAIGSL